MAEKKESLSQSKPLGRSRDLSVQTIKRNRDHGFSMNNGELLDLLSAMEADLQAKEIAIATLEAEKARHFIIQARYGCFSADNPNHALLRDLSLHEKVGVSRTESEVMVERPESSMKHVVEKYEEEKKISNQRLQHLTQEYDKAIEIIKEMANTVNEQSQVTIRSRDLEHSSDLLLNEVNELKLRISMIEEERDSLFELLSSEKEVNRIQRLAALMLVNDRKKCAQRIATLVSYSHELENSLQAEKSKSEFLASELYEAKRSLDTEQQLFARERLLHKQTLEDRESEIQRLREEQNELRCSTVRIGEMRSDDSLIDARSGRSADLNLLSVNKSTHDDRNNQFSQSEVEVSEIIQSAERKGLKDRLIQDYEHYTSFNDTNVESDEQRCRLSIALGSDPVLQDSSNSSIRSSVIGSMIVTRGMSWAELERVIVEMFTDHMTEMSAGLRTKRVARLDTDHLDNSFTLSLGISLSGIKYYSIDRYHWSPGKASEKLPFEMLAKSQTKTILIQLNDLDSLSLDRSAYDSLIPLSFLQNYLRLMEMYRCVIFYGPKWMGKTSLVQKLAQCIQIKQRQNGCSSEITMYQLTESFSRTDLISLLIDKGCLLPASVPSPPRSAPILILEDLSKIDVVEVFKDVLPLLEARGATNQITIRNDNMENNPQLTTYYLQEKCYIFGTMDRSRSTGLELSVQQRFKWVQLRCDQEPMKFYLHRHMLRSLTHHFLALPPDPDDQLCRVVEWVINVWQRLNDGLAKLGLLDIVFGPCLFLSCPVESGKPKVIMRWLNLLWNSVVAPAITSAVMSSSMCQTSGNVRGGEIMSERKIASTALYVLMQRAVVSGCPLTGQEKTRYFSSFEGSNDLDIKIKGGTRQDQKTATTSSVVNSQDFSSTPVADINNRLDIMAQVLRDRNVDEDDEKLGRSLTTQNTTLNVLSRLSPSKLLLPSPQRPISEERHAPPPSFLPVLRRTQAEVIVKQPIKDNSRGLDNLSAQTRRN